MSKFVISTRVSEDVLVGKDCVSYESCSVSSEAESSDSKESVDGAFTSSSLGKNAEALDSKWTEGSSLLDEAWGTEVWGFFGGGTEAFEVEGLEGLFCSKL